MRRAAVVLCLAGLACAPSAAQRVAEPIAPARDWVSPLHRDHPLVGKIWDVREGRFVDERAVVAAAAGAKVLVLGETHDNVDHHLLQARLVRSVASAGRSPAVAFEMLTPEQQPAIDAVLAQEKPSADALGAAVAWDKTGWPPFKAYRPIFVEALAARLPIVGANLPRKQVREIMMKGKDAVPPAVAARIERKGPPSAAEEDALKEEMEAAHCGELPAAHMGPMLLGQRSRDAQMAEAVIAAAKRSGAVVLVTGAEHARRDRGVPAYLLGDAGDPVVSVAFREVFPEGAKPEEYSEEEGVAKLPYDFVVFTPAAEREDPCEQLRERSRSRREQPAAAPATSTPAEAPKPAQPAPTPAQPKPDLPPSQP
jgi:uncharacterized iron-regulated protein